MFTKELDVSELSKDKLLASSLCSTLVDLLKNPETDQHYESVLDILITLSEWGKWQNNIISTFLLLIFRPLLESLFETLCNIIDSI